MWRLKPHQRRYVDFVNACPPVRGSKDPILAAHLDRTLQMDIAAQRELRARLEKLPLLAYAGWSSSSGLRMATELRRFWFEYFDRFARHGPTSLPSSFNVIEAFVRFDPDCLAFLPRPEREHLLRFGDYLDWYTASSFPEEPRSLIDIMEEGVSYSYDFALSHDEPTLRARGAQLLCAGVTLIRHGDELAVLMLAGENPALEVTDFEFDDAGLTTVRGKEKLGPSPHATADTRLLEGWASHSRVLLAARFDLSNRLNDVRYILRDLGNCYDITTDDFGMIRHSFGLRVSELESAPMVEHQKHTLGRYADLFSAAAASIFLPVYFIDQHSHVVTTVFQTLLGTERKSTKVRRLRRELGDDFFRPDASVHCVVRGSASVTDQYKIEPPSMRFHSSGYWKALEPGLIGATADGKPIVGKTWVHRTEMWESSTPEAFIARCAGLLADGRGREQIYIMRSPSHAADVYKIGVTTRTTEARRDELTRSTAAPLPFEILASWNVRDAKSIERAVHARLGQYRLNPRREFFRMPLSDVVKVVETVVAEAGAA